MNILYLDESIVLNTVEIFFYARKVTATRDYCKLNLNLNRKICETFLLE